MLKGRIERPLQFMHDGKFHRVGDPLTGKPPGSGLGLHISRQIVEHFGGRMWVESAVGGGARFTFVLPIGGSA